ncbi:MAG: apolipoprotein N-acyltransferase [Pedosphaera sp.]|nr:apolipoprotein N-acyltransferase [Pedosphaera sp.]
MKLPFWQSPEWKRAALAIVSGLALACAFPNCRVTGLAWIAPGLILASGGGVSEGKLFRAGWLAGFAYSLAAFYWLLHIPVPVAPVVGWIALSAYIALYFGTWVWLCWSILPGGGRNRSELLVWRDMSTRFGGLTFGERQGWCLLCGIIWVGLEMIRGRFLTGFPWNFLGTSQFHNLPVIQIASVTGVYGVSFLLAWFGVALMTAIWMAASQSEKPRVWKAEIVVPLLAVALVLAFGVRKMLSPRTLDRTVTMALIQPSIPQTLIWNAGESSNRFQQLLALSEKALAHPDRPQILVWPEAALPNLLRYDAPTYAALTNLVQTHNVWMILGADDAMPRANARSDRDVDYFNSSFLINPAGEIVEQYRKRQLVPFGEFTPLARWIPPLRHLLPAGEGFRAGDRAVPFRLNKPDVKTSVLICFEDIFPHLARADVESDTDFLLNLTNNGWFGESAAQWQHAAGAVFRAVENGLPLVRCANNGLTCWVDSIGAMHDVQFTMGPQPSNVYAAGFKIVKVPLLPRGSVRPATLYQLYGDWFGWSCAGITLALLVLRLGPGVLARLSRKRNKSPSA